MPLEVVAPTHHDGLDLYLPQTTPAPAVVLVHGGPVPSHLEVRPPRWTAFSGYGSLIAQSGAVAVMCEHHYTPVGEVDPERVLLWFFSGGRVLAGSWLAKPPARLARLAGVALTYPVLEHLAEGLSEQVTPVEALRARCDTPMLLTRVEHERDWIAPSQQAFLTAATDAGSRVGRDRRTRHVAWVRDRGRHRGRALSDPARCGLGGVSLR